MDLWDKPLAAEAIARARRAYFGACTYVDSKVGELLKTLNACGLAEDTIELPISDLVPADVKGEAEQIIADIRSGAFHPFTGPILDQAGAVKIPAGAVASNAELAGMNYYVKGITAQLPK
jgi:basic membrane lipoprotein Med (substrate-binding protein (PBP1-ABC) superfamily)